MGLVFFFALWQFSKIVHHFLKEAEWQFRSNHEISKFLWLPQKGPKPFSFLRKRRQRFLLGLAHKETFGEETLISSSNIWEFDPLLCTYWARDYVLYAQCVLRRASWLPKFLREEAAFGARNSLLESLILASAFALTVKRTTSCYDSSGLRRTRQ